MLAERLMGRVMNATVRLKAMGGQGVLVPGGFILTAAHCIQWSGTGGMALGDYFLEEVRTRDGRKFKASVVAAEPAADVAALGPAEGDLYDDYFAFDNFADEVEAVPLFFRTVNVGKPVAVKVLSRKGKWVKGEVVRYGLPEAPPAGRLALRTEGRIACGDSGGPVVDRFGRLVGLVSWVSENRETDGRYIGMVPVPCEALPCWIVNRIKAAGRQGE